VQGAVESHKSAVRPTIYTDAIFVDIWQRCKIAGKRDLILILSATEVCVCALLELLASKSCTTTVATSDNISALGKYILPVDAPTVAFTL
jgi:hypothetical protein